MDDGVWIINLRSSTGPHALDCSSGYCNERKADRESNHPDFLSMMLPLQKVLFFFSALMD